LFQHTRITTTGTLVGTDAQFVTLSNLPRCIVGGMVGAKIVGENTNTITVFARSVHGDSVGDNNIFQVGKRSVYLQYRQRILVGNRQR
jgi:hypothetical protein